MAGRGGGAGRGRAAMSFNVEQLGFTAGEMLPGPVLQPPPLYPTLEFYPAPLETGPVYKEQVKFKTSYVNYLNNSAAFVQADEIRKGLGNFMDADKENTGTIDKTLDYDWTHFPSELMPIVRKKRKSKNALKAVPNKLLRKQSANVTTLLDELEKKEGMAKEKDNEVEETEKKKSDEDGEEEGDKEDYEDDDFDEEMDDGNDYNDNYFDNGESYLDDSDDNMDDGPIY